MLEYLWWFFLWLWLYSMPLWGYLSDITDNTLYNSTFVMNYDVQKKQNEKTEWSFKHHSCSLDDRDRAEYLSIHHKDTTQVLILCWDAASQIWIIFSVVHKQTLASSTFIRFLWTLSMGQLKRHQITLLFKDGVQYKPWHMNTDASRWDVHLRADYSSLHQTQGSEHHPERILDVLKCVWTARHHWPSPDRVPDVCPPL